MRRYQISSLSASQFSHACSHRQVKENEGVCVYYIHTTPVTAKRTFDTLLGIFCYIFKLKYYYYYYSYSGWRTTDRALTCLATLCACRCYRASITSSVSGSSTEGGDPHISHPNQNSESFRFSNSGLLSIALMYMSCGWGRDGRDSGFLRLRMNRVVLDYWYFTLK